MVTQINYNDTDKLFLLTNLPRKILQNASWEQQEKHLDLPRNVFGNLKHLLIYYNQC